MEEMAHTVPRREVSPMRRAAMAGLVLASILGLNAGQRTLVVAAAEPGVTSHTIHLGGVLDQTGFGTLISKPILGGYQLAIKETNAHGGINGRLIQYDAANDNYDPSKTLPALKQIIEGDNVFGVLGVFGSDDANVAAPYLENRHIPL